MPKQISTVTKHIKLYSDNPIHEAIDRVIESCSAVDEAGDDPLMASIYLGKLAKAADELLFLSGQAAGRKSAEVLRSLEYGKK